MAILYYIIIDNIDIWLPDDNKIFQYFYEQKKHGNKEGKLECQVCKNEVKGQIIRAVGFAFHPDCFKCCECKKDLSRTKQFTTDKSNHLYCQKDYNE